MSAQILQVEFGGTPFEVEVIDEGEGEVLTFDDPAIFAEFEEAEATVQSFDHPSIRRRVLELRDQLLTITGELDLLLADAA
ncbi:hypothetical protein [Leucobacter luti]|uniref:hypothetical protein n=1 Tax=Leucobacter luti TaxID=340320 RepID=UPI00105D5C0F|nr:hypothetical protein [Leucobacter luti]